jgi:hypothetical protein
MGQVAMDLHTALLSDLDLEIPLIGATSLAN